MLLENIGEDSGKGGSVEIFDCCKNVIQAGELLEILISTSCNLCQGEQRPGLRETCINVNIYTQGVSCFPCSHLIPLHCVAVLLWRGFPGTFLRITWGCSEGREHKKHLHEQNAMHSLLDPIQTLLPKFGGTWSLSFV